MPNLQKVIVAVGEEIVIAGSFEEALEAAIPGLNIDLSAVTAVGGDVEPEPSAEDPPVADDDPPSDTIPDNDAGGDENRSLMDLIELAHDAFDKADAALRDGDLAAYQAAVEEAEGYISRAQLLLPSEVDPPTTSSTTEPAAA